MERSKYQCTYIPRWCAMTAAALVLLYCSGSVWNNAHPAQISHNVQWRTLSTETSKRILTENKCALLFVRDQSQLSLRMEYILEKKDLAKFINEHYVPVVVTDRRTPNERFPAEISDKIDRARVNGAPAVIVVPPDAWDTRDADYSRPSCSDYSSAIAVESMIRDNANYRSEPTIHRIVYWNEPSKALKEATVKKPALLLFVRSRDEHSVDETAELFSTYNNIREEVNANYRPALVVDQSRTGKENPKITKELLAKYHITSFPALVVCPPDRDPQVMVDFSSDTQTLEWLKQNRSPS